MKVDVVKICKSFALLLITCFAIWNGIICERNGDNAIFETMGSVTGVE